MRKKRKEKGKRKRVSGCARAKLVHGSSERVNSRSYFVELTSVPSRLSQSNAATKARCGYPMLFHFSSLGH